MSIFAFIIAFFSPHVAVTDETTISCQFKVPGFDQFLDVATTEGQSTFDKTIGEFQFHLDLDKQDILSIEIKDLAREVTSNTISTTGAAIFARPRQLGMNSGGRYAEVNCW